MKSTTLTAPRPGESESDHVPVDNALVGMGQIAILSPTGVGRSVLGSCVGLVLYESGRRYAAMAHIVLPDSKKRSGAAGKFADTAVASMIQQLRALGIEPSRLIAKAAGGGRMFETKGPFQIGDQNVAAVRKCLAAARIRLVAEHVGGTSGRRTMFDCRSGEMRVEVLGASPVVL